MDDLTEKLNAILNNPQEMEKIKNLAGMLGQQSTPAPSQPQSETSLSDGDTLSRLLGQAGGAEGIASMLGQLGGAQALSGLLGNTNQSNHSATTPIVSNGLDPNLLQSILKIAPILGSMQKEDQNTQLLHALRPLLGPERRKKLDEAARMMQLLRILPLLKGQGIL